MSNSPGGRPSAASIQDLLDKQEIHEVLMRYCRGVDRQDLELFESAYWPDAWDDHGLFKGPVADLIALNRAIKAAPEDSPMTSTFMQHNICNEYVLVEGDVAWSEAYFIGYHGCLVDGEEIVYTLGGRYLDRFERRRGEWRIRERIVAADWESTTPRSPGFWSPSPWVPGRMSQDDPVFGCWGKSLNGAPQAKE